MAPAPKHHVVCLEECHCAIPTFAFPYTYRGYPNTAASEVAARIQDATIVIATIVHVTPAMLEQAQHIQLLAVMATGMDWVNREYCAKRGIDVVSCPGSNIPAVSEHAMGLYFAARKRIVEMHNLTVGTDEWAREGTLTKMFPGGPPLSAGQEVMGVVGYGALGRRIEGLARAVGFGEVLVAERKGVVEGVREQRVGFEEVLRRATVVVLCCPRNESTINLIAGPEFEMMRKDALLINVARGGIVNEAALATALREGQIGSAATDVLETEPPGVDGSPLLPVSGDPIPNLTISPHIAWFAQDTIKTLQQLLKGALDGWVAGKPINMAVHDGKIYK